MGRRSLAPDAGMVFLEDGPTDATFWMKGTLIPLSIAFWSSDGRILNLQDMEPCRADPCPLYRSTAPYVGAVEVNRGFFEAHDVTPGDLVRLDSGSTAP